MGDAAHRQRKSDHNAGNAIDITHWAQGGLDTWLLADELRRQMRSYPAGRLSLIIARMHVAEGSTGWVWRPYRGRNPHTSHVHLSIRTSARLVVRPWRLM